MTSDTLLIPPRASARQRTEFRDGDEAAAFAASAVGALDLSTFGGDDGAALAAACYGAALGGTRVVAATGSQGLLPALAQLVAQSSARVPMVLNAACDHAELYDVLNAGWIVLCAREPQAVYDFNLAAVKIGEHPDVRLPVLVAYDAFSTRHEKRRILVVDDPPALEAFVGARPEGPTPLDTTRPATFGAHMEDADVAMVRAQLTQAMEAARKVIFDVFGEVGRLTGRFYPHVDAYDMQEAEVALVVLNSASGAARETVDLWRAAERRAGVLSPNVLRPFPAKEFRAQLRGVRAATVAERADSYGAVGGSLSIELRAALQQDPGSDTRILSRIYGKAFHPADAEQLLDQALVAATTGQVRDMFAYHGAGSQEPPRPRRALPPVRGEQVPRGMAKVRRNAQTGRLEVELEPLWKMTAVPSRIAPGHGACPGCGAFTTLHQIFKVLEGDVVGLFQSGCATVVSTSYPTTAHRINFVHNAAAHGAATLSGLMTAYQERVRRGELPESTDLTFVMVTGDGALEADLADAIAAANRNRRMIILEYDNQGRMSTSAQPTGSAPQALAPRTSDLPQVFASCHVPYVFTASEAYPEDLMRKAAKAQWYAKNEGLAYGKVLSFCPLNWRTAEDAAQPVLQAAIDSCFFPLYEVERGHTTLTYDPDATARRRPVAEWLKLMGRTAALVEPANAQALAAIQAETDRRWARLKAMHGHPLL